MQYLSELCQNDVVCISFINLLDIFDIESQWSMKNEDISSLLFWLSTDFNIFHPWHDDGSKAGRRPLWCRCRGSWAPRTPPPCSPRSPGRRCQWGPGRWAACPRGRWRLGPRCLLNKSLSRWCSSPADESCSPIQNSWSPHQALQNFHLPSSYTSW